MLKKIFLATILSIFLIQNICAAESGNCGDNVRWNFDGSTLTISGNGKMTDFLIEDKNSAQYGWFYDTGWENFKNRITAIVVQDGVTSVGSHAFADLTNLKTVTLANSVQFIGSQAFSGCTNLETITFSATAKTGDEVFARCDKLSNLNTVDATGKILVASNNLNANEYNRWAKVVNSYLYVDGENLIRVENIGGKVLVEKYSADFKLLSSQNLDIKFELWGGFFAGKNFNFIITGKSNDAESDSNEVISISKFDKNFNLLDTAKIFGSNTKVPFDAASLRCAEKNGTLYIHTGHKMYRSPDGLNHQASMSIFVNESTMQISNINYAVSNISTGYVSHSFNQFILVDDRNNVVYFDHGDAFPRAAVLIRGKQNVEIVKFAGYMGDNATGAAIGGLAETNNNYVTAYTYDGRGGNMNDYFGVINQRDMFLSFTSKNNFATGTLTFKAPDPNYSYGTPILVPTSLNGGYVLCNETKFDGKYFKPSGRIIFADYEDGGKSNTIQAVEGQLSDCQPIIFNGKVTWYVTNNSAPIFYTLDEGGVTAHKS